MASVTGSSRPTTQVAHQSSDPQPPSASVVAESGAPNAAEADVPEHKLVKDVLLIVGPGHEGTRLFIEGKNAIDHFREIALARGLNLIVVGDGERDVDLHEIAALKEDGKLPAMTPVMLLAHGAETDGHHRIRLQRAGEPADTSLCIGRLHELGLSKLSIYSCKARYAAKNIVDDHSRPGGMSAASRYDLRGGSQTALTPGLLRQMAGQLHYYGDCLEARKTPSDVEEHYRAMQETPLCLCFVEPDPGVSGKLRIVHFPSSRPDELGQDAIQQRIERVAIQDADGNKIPADAPAVLELKKAMHAASSRADGAPADLNASEQQRHTNIALLNAGRRNKMSKVAELLDRGADWRYRHGGWASTLKAIVHEGHADVVALLLDSGKPLPGRKALFGYLVLAADRGHDKVIDVLLGRMDGAEADPEQREALLFEAIKGGHAKLAAALLDKGADANCVRGGISAVQAAVAELKFDVVKTLVEKGALLDEGEADRLMHSAAASGSFELAVILAQKGTKLPDGVIDKVCSAGRYDLAGSLLDCGHAPSQKKLDYLAMLASSGAPDAHKTVFLAKLVGKGAALDDFSLEHLGANGGHAALLKALWTVGAPDRSTFDLIERLLAKGAHAETQVLNSMLEGAVIAGHSGAFKALLAKGGDCTHEIEGYSLLQIAAMNGNADIARLLLEAKPALLDHGAQGMTPLFIAILKGHEAFVRVLLERGADVARIWNGKTCEQVAEDAKQAGIVTLLRDWSAKAQV